MAKLRKSNPKANFKSLTEKLRTLRSERARIANRIKQIKAELKAEQKKSGA